jgi:hypothetical protein
MEFSLTCSERSNHRGVLIISGKRDLPVLDSAKSRHVIWHATNVVALFQKMDLTNVRRLQIVSGKCHYPKIGKTKFNKNF